MIRNVSASPWILLMHFALPLTSQPIGVRTKYRKESYIRISYYFESFSMHCQTFTQNNDFANIVPTIFSCIFLHHSWHFTFLSSFCDTCLSSLRANPAEFVTVLSFHAIIMFNVVDVQSAQSEMRTVLFSLPFYFAKTKSFPCPTTCQTREVSAYPLINFQSRQA